MNANFNFFAPGTDDPLELAFNPDCIAEGYKEEEWPQHARVDFPRPYPTLSYWQQAFRHRLDHYTSSADLPTKTDVVIIGSGLTGCSAAYHFLSENPGLNVVMLEARAFCSGSTGRNGGHLGRPEGFDFQADIEAIGPEMYREARSMFMENRRLMFDHIQSRQLADQISMTWTGGVQIFGSEKEREVAMADLAAMEALGFKHQTTVLRKEEMAKEMDCENMYGGLYTKAAGSFWPRKYCAAMAEETLKNHPDHFKLYTNTCATAVKAAATGSDVRWEVETNRGKIGTRSVLHATNAWLCALLPELMKTEDEVIPDRELAVAVRPSPKPGSQGTWKNNVMATNGFHYLAQMPKDPSDSRENVVIYGLVGERNSSDDSTLITQAQTGLNAMTEFLARVFPSKFSAQDAQGRVSADTLENVWTGLIGRTQDGRVVVGPVAGKKGQFTAAGFNGAGMAKCFFTGKTIADMMAWELRDPKPREDWQPPEHYPRWFLRHLDEL